MIQVHERTNLEGVDTKNIKNFQICKRGLLKPWYGLKDFLFLQKLDEKVVFER